MNPCRICRADAEIFLSLGRMPLADGFREPDSEAEEFTYELAVAQCARCHMAGSWSLSRFAPQGASPVLSP
jgi:hypothetical protein